jgi:nicotinamide-nucleotide amidase
MLTDDTLRLATALLGFCAARGLTIATAESCTGGLITATLTAIAGASAVVDRGFVTYSNAAKTALVGVPAALIETHGAVSEPVARAMAEGALAAAGTTLAVAVTGVAGPGGGSEAKPVGLVWFGFARAGQPTRSEARVFEGDRTAIRDQTVSTALAGLRAYALS